MTDSIIKKDVAELYPVSGGDLGPKIDTAIVQIQSMNPVFKAWNRSHSDVMWNLFNLDHESETRNLREIGASIKKRRDAMTECHFAYKENLIEAEIYEDKAAKEDAPLQKKKYEMLAQKERAFAAMKHESILGATKDISALKASYDKIMARIVEKHGRFDEAVFEEEEKEYFIRRLFVQAMRDVRECGQIRTGAQRDLEQMGIEPIEAHGDIMKYIVFVKENLQRGSTISRGCRDDWAKNITEKYIKRVQDKLDHMGFSDDHLYKLESGNDT